MNSSHRYFLSAGILFCSLAARAQPAADAWTHFRGTQLNGISRAIQVPLHWNDSTNIDWKTPIPGKGWSSPLVLDGQVWLTTAIPRTREMRALCLDYSSGAITHNLLLFRPDSLYRIHAVNSYATPTGAIEGNRVYLHFGRYGTACLDRHSGEKIWERTDIQVEHIQGPGSSLLIHKDMLIVHLEGSDVQYILALDKATGKTRWKVERPAAVWDRLEYIGKKAYTTPIVVEVDGRRLLISNGSAACIAYDVETGEEVWRIVEGEDSTIAMPTESDGLVYFYMSFATDSGGQKEAALLAADPGGYGDVGESHVVWRKPSPILQLLTPVVVEGLLYTVDSRGNMQCLDAATGEVVWSRRMKGKFHASPLYACGRLYFFSTRGLTCVMKAGREAVELAENQLEGEIWATPAILDGALLIRTSENLYKIRRP